MNTVSAADPVPALKALADPSRLRLVRLLDREELSVGELAESTGLRQSSVSRHLASLRKAGFVEERTEGVRTYLRCAAESEGPLRALHAALLDLIRREDFGHDDDLVGLTRVLRARTESREELFDRLAEDWDALRVRLLGGHLAPAEVAGLLLPAGLRVVDAGAGTGISLPWLSALAGPDGAVIAVEASAGMVERAIQRTHELANVDVRRGRIEALPVDDDWADAVLLSLSLGHTDDIVAALRACVRATRPGGRVAVADVERHNDATLTSRLGPGFAGFHPDALLNAMRAAGLEAVRRVDLPSTAPLASVPGRRVPTPTIEPLRPLYAVGLRPR